MLGVLEGQHRVGIDGIVKRMRERLAAVGLSANEASRRSGLTISYANDILTGKSKNPVPHRLAQLATVLDCDVEYLLGEQNEVKSSRKSVSQVGELTVPISSASLPDNDGFFRLQSNEGHYGSIHYGSVDTYAVVVPDDSNAPRYFAGEVVIASPNRPVSRGGFAVIRMNDGRVAIRRVEAILSQIVKASTLESGASVDIHMEDIEAIHKIVGTSEAFV